MLMHTIYGILLKIVCCKLVMEVCGKKKRRKNDGYAWWWNEDVKEAIQQKKVTYKMCKNRSEENKAKYKNIKN